MLLQRRAAPTSDGATALTCPQVLGHRFSSLTPVMVDWNPSSRSDLVYRGQVTTAMPQIANKAINTPTPHLFLDSAQKGKALSRS